MFMRINENGTKEIQNAPRPPTPQVVRDWEAEQSPILKKLSSISNGLCTFVQRANRRGIKARYCEENEIPSPFSEETLNRIQNSTRDAENNFKQFKKNPNHRNYFIERETFYKENGEIYNSLGEMQKSLGENYNSVIKKYLQKKKIIEQVEKDLTRSGISIDGLRYRDIHGLYEQFKGKYFNQEEKLFTILEQLHQGVVANLTIKITQFILNKDNETKLSLAKIEQTGYNLQIDFNTEKETVHAHCKKHLMLIGELSEGNDILVPIRLVNMSIVIDFSQEKYLAHEEFTTRGIR